MSSSSGGEQQPSTSLAGRKRKKGNASSATSETQSTPQLPPSSSAVSLLAQAEGDNEVFEIDDDDVVLKKRLAEKTKTIYQGALERATKFFIDNGYTAAFEPGTTTFKLPMELEHWRWFLGKKSRPLDKNGKVYAKSTLEQFVTALKNIHTERNIVIDPIVTNYLKKFVVGYGKLVAEKKQIGVMKNHEGKHHFTFDVYVQLCKAALFANETRSHFARFVHVFICFCWNMIARANSVAELGYHAISWEADCLIVDMSKHKGAQSGERISAKHIFANPFEPAVCPILSLAIHTFCTSDRPEGPEFLKLFSGSPYETLINWLKEVLPDIQNLGFSVDDYGTHSFRKGGASHVASIPGGPGLVTIFGRADWSMGQVQDRYLTNVQGGDQLCGRLVCGLHFSMGTAFSVIPPRFKLASKVLTESQWNDILPRYNEYPREFQSTLPFLLAQICYHYNWLMERDENGKGVNISETHMLFNSRLFRSPLFGVLRSSVLLPNIVGECKETGIIATGVPENVNLMRKADVQLDLMKNLMNEHALFRKDVMEHLPHLVATEIRKGFVFQGDVNKVSKEEMQLMVDDQYRKIEKLLEERLKHYGGTGSASDVRDDTTVTYEEGKYWLTKIDDIYYKAWNWDCKIGRPVPKEFTFPKTRVRDICDMFVYGDRNGGIRPFGHKLFDSKLLPRKFHSYFSKAQNVFVGVRYFALCTVELNLGSEDDINHKMPTDRWDHIFNVGFAKLMAYINQGREKPLKNPGEMNYTTCFDHIKIREKIVLQGDDTM